MSNVRPKLALYVVEKTSQLALVRKWYDRGGLLVMSMPQFHACVTRRVDNAVRRAAAKGTAAAAAAAGVVAGTVGSDATALRETLCREQLINADVVVVDEGHAIRSDNGAHVQSLNKLRTRRRIVLTGTPIQVMRVCVCVLFRACMCTCSLIITNNKSSQNNLEELWTMVNFTQPGYLCQKTRFLNFFNPINEALVVDASPATKAMATRRENVLARLLVPVLHRCDSSVLAVALPPKHEFVIEIAVIWK